MAIDEEKLHEMIALIYEASADTDLWPELLDRLSDYITLDLALPDAADEAYAEKSSIRNILTKHFTKAARINKKISTLNENLNASVSVLNRLPIGLMFVQSGGKVVFANHRAQNIFESDYGLSICQGTFMLQLAQARDLLYLYIDDVLKGTVEGSKSIDIEDVQQRRLTLTVSPLKSGIPDEKSPHYVMVLISTPDSPFHVGSESLKNKFGLTPAEARLALALVDNGSLDRAGEQLGITMHTARSHLKTIFHKTNTSKQAALIKLLLTSPEAIIADSASAAAAPIALDRKWSDMPRTARYIRLYDGRKLGFAEYGNSDGAPILVHHGVASSRLQMHPDEKIAVDAGVRLIVPDRPGMGISDFQENRQIEDWAGDIGQLMDQLGIKNCAMMGLAVGGGHYAQQCAYSMPDRVTTLHLVSTRSLHQAMKPAPSVRVLLGMAHAAPKLFYQYLRVMGKSVMKNPESYLERRMSDFAECDQQFLATEEGKHFYLTPFIESLQQGTDGIAWDLTVSMQGWDFDIRNIKSPISIWHGREDKVVPMEEVEVLINLLPKSRTYLFENEGQFLFMNHWPEILRKISDEHRKA